MVKNVIKGSFPMSKVLVFEDNSYVCWKKYLKNKDIRQFYDCTWQRMWLKALFLFQKLKFSRVIATYVEKMRLLDYFMIAHGKECD